MAGTSHDSGIDVEASKYSAPESTGKRKHDVPSREPTSGCLGPHLTICVKSVHEASSRDWKGQDPGSIHSSKCHPRHDTPAVGGP